VSVDGAGAERLEEDERTKPEALLSWDLDS
jgi:hypothetical protein